MCRTEICPSGLDRRFNKSPGGGEKRGHRTGMFTEQKRIRLLEVCSILCLCQKEIFPSKIRSSAPLTVSLSVGYLMEPRTSAPMDNPRLQASLSPFRSPQWTLAQGTRLQFTLMPHPEIPRRSFSPLLSLKKLFTKSYFFFPWPCQVACGILFPHPKIKPLP